MDLITAYAIIREELGQPTTAELREVVTDDPQLREAIRIVLDFSTYGND